jgi:hypothetical protein
MKMNSKNALHLERRLRSPRSAAIAGIIFSLLMLTIMIMSYRAAEMELTNITGEWLESWMQTAHLMLTLVPFAGIAFLWFTGVVRDRMSELEDRFFETIFFGSGIILVMLWFFWGSVFGAILGTRVLTAIKFSDETTYLFGFVLMNEILGNYTLRITGVYMLSIGSAWNRTDVMPRWLTILTYIMALSFILIGGSIREARFTFPGWVLLVSIYILITNYRRKRDQEVSSELLAE